MANLVSLAQYQEQASFSEDCANAVACNLVIGGSHCADAISISPHWPYLYQANTQADAERKRKRVREIEIELAFKQPLTQQALTRRRLSFGHEKSKKERRREEIKRAEDWRLAKLNGWSL